MAKSRDDLEDTGKPPKEERKLSALDRALMAAIGDGLVVGRQDDPAQNRYPLLWEWLTKTEGGRDYIMQPAVISIQLGPEGCLATVTHRDLRRSVQVACLNLDDCLAALEDTLGKTNCPVKTWGKDQPHLRKRRPKA